MVLIRKIAANIDFTANFNIVLFDQTKLRQLENALYSLLSRSR